MYLFQQISNQLKTTYYSNCCLALSLAPEVPQEPGQGKHLLFLDLVNIPTF